MKAGFEQMGLIGEQIVIECSKTPDLLTKMLDGIADKLPGQKDIQNLPAEFRAEL